MKKWVLLLAGISSGASFFAQTKEIIQASDKAQRVFDQQIAPKKRAVDPLFFVNPFIGTGGHGHTFPGPVLPFGMVQVGPDTRYEGWDGCGGYHYSDSIIYGFSQTHLSGTGIPDYADILVVPQQDKLNTILGYKEPNGFGAKFSHDKEIATPGFYSVHLENGIDVSLTATARCSMHRYRFSGSGKKYLVIDMGYRDKVLEADIQVTSPTAFSGKRISAAWAVHQHVYFSAELSLPAKSKIIREKSGKYLLVLEFPKTTKEVVLKMGISGTGVAGATGNLKAEITDFDFELVQRKAANAWREALGKITFAGADQTALTNFYTALYHTYIHPSLWSDVDGKYRDFNDQIQQGKRANYSVFSLWDTYRGANPLYTIIQPERAKDFIASFQDQYRCTGQLPMWTLSNNETYCMIGYHNASIIADAYLKGIELEDPEELLKAMVATSRYNQFGKPLYDKYGFIPANLEAESVSKTLEYAYDDWCIAQMARKVGNSKVAAEYELRAANWMNLIHPESHFFQARKGGMFLPFFVPNEVNHHYTEANAWQYSMAAPQHITSLIDMHGGKQAFEGFLDSLFFGSSQMSGRVQSDITGLIGQYAHGNEPSHHIAYLYNYAGTPWKTQELVDRILHEMYTNNPDGLSGNEDCGQMSAWYVLSAMGFYPVAPGSPTYALGRPLANYCKIDAGAVPFEIRTVNNSDANKYIQSISWNGEPYQKLYITHEMLVQGGLLELTMGDKPNESLATYQLDLTETVPANFVPVPYFVTKKTVFESEIEVNLDKLFFEKGAIYYSFDSLHFEPFNPVDGKNLVLRESGKVYAKVVRANGEESKVVSCFFQKFIRTCELTLETPYANQYPGVGPQTLVDGQRGTDEYRGTEWQGFNNTDVKGVITFFNPRTVNRVKVSYLADTHAWIFPPKGLIVETSMDGVTYKKAGRIALDPLKKDIAKSNRELVLELVPTECKYIRFTIENYGAIPDWHLSPGSPTWLFLDEIMVE